MNQGLVNKAAQMYGDAYGKAQDRAVNYANMYPSMMSAPLGMYGAVGDVGAQQRALQQEGINRNMARYQYDANKGQQQLGNYMNMISGN